MALLDELLSAAANPYGTPSTGEWNLIQGSFTNSKNATCIFFYEKVNKTGPISQILGAAFGGSDRESPTRKTYLEQISDGGGRRVAKYEYAYKNGQAVKDLGRKGERFTFNIKFVGTNYQDKFREFLSVIADVKGSGILSHPVRGKVQAQFSEWEFIHRHDEHNAVTIRATFEEDNTDQILSNNGPPKSNDEVLRTALQGLTLVQASIQQTIFTASAALLLPAAIQNAMILRVQSITGQASTLLGQLAATFSSDSKLKSLANSASKVSGGVTSLNSGTVYDSSTGTQAKLPPVYQVGFSEEEMTTITAQQSQYNSANQITTQQAVFSTNQVRMGITEALNEIDLYLGNNGFDATLQYRVLAIQLQQATEVCVSSAQSKIKIYKVPYDMSLRSVAFNCGLEVDRQNDIESLNPYIESVTLVRKGTILTVPSS